MAIELRNRDRERKLIKKIDETLGRINGEDYGYRDKCGVEIGIKRLKPPDRDAVHRLQDAGRTARSGQVAEAVLPAGPPWHALGPKTDAEASFLLPMNSRASGLRSLLSRRRLPLRQTRPSSTGARGPSSASSTFTRTCWPSLSLSEDLLDALVGDLRDMQQAVAARHDADDGTEIEQLQHGAFVDLAHSTSAVMSLMRFFAASAASAETEAMVIVPSSWMSIVVPVSSVMARMTAPPLPITSRIFPG